MLLCLLLCLSGAANAEQIRHKQITVVAAENVWGSIAAQIGGDRVNVVSILTDPNADPHEFESNVVTAEHVATADYVIINGAGYDSWAGRLLETAAQGDRRVLDVSILLGKRPGDNPHFWYAPEYLERVADRIRNDFQALDPSHRAVYAQRRSMFESALRPYYDQIALIRARYPGEAVGATENIVVYLAAALDLHLVTPPAFMAAVANGTEPSVDAVEGFDSQIDRRAIRALIYNTQTATALTTNARRLANARHIPIVDVTETMIPPNGRFQDWQTAQLRSLARALAR
jgi:zinc/manganese transport system substrate-binding protein